MSFAMYQPSSEAVVDAARQWDDGVAARLLVEALEECGFSRRNIERRVQSCLDRGELRLGRNLWLFPRDSDGSGEAGETQRGSTEGDSAGPQGHRQNLNEINRMTTSTRIKGKEINHG